MRGVALNFFPLAMDQFKITLYCLPFAGGERPKSGDEEAVRRYLKIDDEENTDRRPQSVGATIGPRFVARLNGIDGK